MKQSYLYSSIYPLLFIVAIITSCTGQSNSNVLENNVPELKATPKTAPHYVASKSMILSMFKDSKGNFWFGRDHSGLSRYDGKSIAHFSMKDGLSDNQIRTIQEDQNGNIWFATGNGISKYDGEKFTIQTTKDYLPSNSDLNNQWGKGRNDLWFNGELERGIYRYDGQSLFILKFPTLDPDHKSFSITGTVTGICEGKNNRLWMANYGGVIGYDGESFTFINERRFNYHVRSIFEDSKGNLWIGNNGIGVLLYDGNTTINFTKEKGLNDKNGQSGGTLSPEGTLNHVFAIAEDRKGNIWFGDRDTGAWRYDGHSLKNFTLKDGLTNTFVRAIYKDPKGDLWIGLGDGNVCKFNGKTFDKMY